MGPLGLAVSTCILGVTNNALAQTTARSLQGVFGGNLETTKSVIAEITDNTNRHRAYAALPLVQSVGISIGSSLGNFLATLKERIPVFERVLFIKEHPLLIPCTISAAFSFFSFHVTHLGFEEVSQSSAIKVLAQFFPQTLPAEFRVDWKTLWGFKDRVLSSIPTSATGLLDEARSISYEQLRLKELITPQLVIALLNYAFISFLDQAQQTLLPMMYTAPIEEYGLGLSPDDMTAITAKWGSYNTLAQLLLFPWLLERHGPKRVYATCLSSMIAFFALFPALNLAANYFHEANLLVRRLSAIHLAMSSLVYMAYGCSQLFIMDAVPDRGSIGSVNGIGQSVGSSARMIAPTMVSLLYAFSLKDSLVGGYLTYVVLACVTLIGSMISALLPRYAPSGNAQ
ncbi:Protein ZINC INDUCED FACILITATOR-LIKE 1 [Leucoagaricus sp. SymC.cos]|nr:Protein ZINC INDUCED FACILITATOR-LIKE 1 [Leucoagaricus sp. SymC.cos]